jgi:uncharacterized protein (TIGR02117 family)
MRPGPFLSASVLAVSFLPWCVAANEPLENPGVPDAARVTSVFLVSHGWHTGIVVRRADIAAGMLPELADFPDAQYYEFGWGDRDFYQSPEFSLGTALRAGMTPTQSVLHVVGLDVPPDVYFPGSEIIELPVPAGRLPDLLRYIHDTVARDNDAAAAPLGPGLYGESLFYRAHGTFHLRNNCNVWTARALRAAGLPIADAVRAKGIMAQARRLSGRGSAK